MLSYPSSAGHHSRHLRRTSTAAPEIRDGTSMRRERKNIWKDADKHFKGHERDYFSQGVQSHASGSTTMGNLSAASTGTLSTPSAGPTPPPTLRGLLVGPSPCNALGISGRLKAGSKSQSPLWARAPADWSSRATFWKSRDRFPGGSLVGCQSRETEKLQNSPTRPPWWFSG